MLCSFSHSNIQELLECFEIHVHNFHSFVNTQLINSRYFHANALIRRKNWNCRNYIDCFSGHGANNSRFHSSQSLHNSCRDFNLFSDYYSRPLSISKCSGLPELQRHRRRLKVCQLVHANE